MAPVTISLTIPEAEIAEDKAAAEAFTGLTGASAKELLAGVVNEVVRKWRNETKGQPSGKVA